ncbi:MOSC domain-containing protein [Aliikangiella sp. G2MR2-5]|uniref:MOSC domain-containing protein n=1 Tax=Aliikangiella sp. G2MR2-5 TaxID=2788943 RepID=UPI0018A89E38|nr:MOSC domain-containing protein [Aliikangiella sp. G2MR2-5]
MSINLSITQILTYPVKSIAGIHHVSARVTPFGLEGDRMKMLVDKNGLFISQRKYPQLALISIQTEGDDLVLNAPGMSEIKIKEAPVNRNSCIFVEVWGDKCRGIETSPEASLWFSEYLKTEIRLVSYDQSFLRPTDPDYSQAGDVVSFADGFPLLLTTEGSLADLNSRLDTPVEMRNFRPNIVVKGCHAFAEDEWKKLRVGEIIFDLVKPCSRCILTTVDPDTGKKSSIGEPLKTLASYRRGPGGVYFGMNLIPRTQGTINLTDGVEIIN